MAPFEPNWTVHPGEILRELLDDHGLSVRVAARLLRMSEADLQAVLDGKASVTPDLAARFAAGLPMTDRMWLNLQERYDRDTERLSQEHR